jgi:hypothetical protein
MSSTAADLDIKTRRLVVALNDASLEIDSTNAREKLDELIELAKDRHAARNQLRAVRAEYETFENANGFTYKVDCGGITMRPFNNDEAARNSCRAISALILAGRL